MSAHDRFEAAAAKWSTSGRRASSLLSGRDLIAARCWTFSRGGQTDGASETLRAFIRASEAAQPLDWLDDHLSERESCRHCGESYRSENLMLCTDCSRTYCHRCAAGGEMRRNGNVACTCGGELVG
jgi:hypothetical protein